MARRIQTVSRVKTGLLLLLLAGSRISSKIISGIGRQSRNGSGAILSVHVDISLDFYHIYPLQLQTPDPDIAKFRSSGPDLFCIQRHGLYREFVDANI